MSHYNFTKVGTLIANTTAYWPCAIDTSGLVGWPWTITIFSSSDHTDAGIYMYGSVGDPTVPSNWESYDQGLARGAFAAFPTKPAGNPIISGRETPHIVKVGNTFYLSCHTDESGLSGQHTSMYTATDYPLNFTRYGVILNSDTTDPLRQYPISSSHHTGYFRWGVNQFSGISGTYFGAGLFGGGDWNRFALYSTSDPLAWNMHTMREQEPVVPGVDSTYEFTWNEFDPNSVRDIGNGEYAALISMNTAASGSSTRYSEVYEIILSADAKRLTRHATKVIPRGDSSTADQYEVGQPCTVVYGGQILCFYQGTNSSNQNSLMLAVGSFNSNAERATPIKNPNFTTQKFVASGESALPTWLTTDGSGLTVSPTNGIVVVPSSGVRTVDSLIPNNESWIEWYVEQGYRDANVEGVPLIQIGTTGPTDTATGVMAVSYTSIGYDTQMRTRSGGSTTTSQNIGNSWGNKVARRHAAGLKWNTSTNTLQFIGQNRDLVYSWSIPSAVKDQALFPRFSVAGSESVYLKSVELRRGVTTGGVAPTITSVLKNTTSSLIVNLSVPCIGLATGLEVQENSTVVPGTWTRGDLNTATFTRTSGTWNDEVGLNLVVTDSELRLSDELVPLQNTVYVVSSGPTPEEPPSGPTLYMAVYPSSDPSPTWDRVSGWSGTPTYEDWNSSPSVSGEFTFVPDSSGLSQNTTYTWYAVWDDGTSTVGPVASSPFQTLSESVSVSSSKEVLYNILSSVSLNKSIQSSVNGSVSKDVSVGYSVRQSVSSNSQIDYSVRGSISSSKGLDYIVRTSASSSKEVLYSVRSSLNSNSNLSWNVRGIVETTKAVLYSLRGTATYSKETSWNVRGGIESSKTILYDIQSATGVSSNLNASWNVRGSVESQRELSYVVRGSVSKSQLSEYFVRGLVQSSLPNTWQVRGLTNSSKTILYDILSASQVSSSRSVNWNVSGTVSSNNQFLWSIRQSLSSGSSIDWNINQSIGSQSSVGWVVRGTVAREVATEWSVKNFVSSSTSVGYSIQSQTSKDLSIQYEVLPERFSVSSDGSVEWTVFQRVNSNLMIQYQAFGTKTFSKDFTVIRGPVATLTSIRQSKDFTVM